MQNFTSIHDVSDMNALIETAFNFKKNQQVSKPISSGKTVVLLFFNPSLRTRLSTQKAAQNLGYSVISLNATQGWKLEFEDQIIMDSAAVISQYADVIGVRTFPSLTDKERDYQDFILQKFLEFATVPVLSLESAIRHPLQSLADILTIIEHQKTARPKVVLTWAPHPKALPQAVANSFSEWLLNWGNADLTITHPVGYELDTAFTKGANIEYNQEKAFANADFIYAKNWSSFSNYGQILSTNQAWMVTAKKMALTNDAKFMHCLPVRRNVVVTDEVLNGSNSLVIEQANNRTFAAQAVLDLL
jgi:N-succinyl-L-ornithine transcarbamylase